MASPPSKRTRIHVPTRREPGPSRPPQPQPAQGEEQRRQPLSLSRRRKKKEKALDFFFGAARRAARRKHGAGPGAVVPRTPVLAGLSNLGNTCFVNAVLQPLRFCAAFVSLLEDLSKHRPDAKVVGCTAVCVYVYVVYERELCGDYRSH